MRFHWLKSGQTFLAHGDTTVQTFEDTSIVTFKKVASSDRGQYTCVATNIASSTNRSIQLIVNGKCLNEIKWCLIKLLMKIVTCNKNEIVVIYLFVLDIIHFMGKNE